MSRTTVTRRALLGYAPAATVAAAVSPMLFAPTAAAQKLSATTSLLAANLPALASSIDRAFSFQNFMMDAYATGTTVRLAQSYSDEALGATAFTYDNAVTIHAYLASEDADLLARAVVLGEGLLYAQAHNFPFNDGRFAQAYFVNVAAGDGSGAFITPAAYPFYFYTSTTGDQAWAGMALAQLYARTGDNRFLTGALLVGNWIVANTYNTLGAGGFSFGTIINQGNGSEPSPNGKSTEHNIDSYAFFTMLSKVTKNGNSADGMSWAALATHALTFVEAMYNAAGPFFYTGTQGDQVTINPTPIPEDCQTWSYLSLLKNSYRKTIDWALAHLEATDTPSSPNSKLTGAETIHGLVFDTASLAPTIAGADPNAVWLEGTGHTIAALIARVLRGQDTFAGVIRDVQTALALVEQSILAQNELGLGKTAGGKAIPAGEGLVASTSVMDTGFGYTYGPSLHIGATGWYLLGVLAANPFHLGYRVIG